MRFQWFKMGVVCGLLGCAIAISRADFQWNPQQGPPSAAEDSACTTSATCVDFGCMNVNPAVTVVPDGKTQSVTVKSYDKDKSIVYGSCTSAASGTCFKYPNVPCAELKIYGLPDCSSIVGIKAVYSGNCTP